MVNDIPSVNIVKKRLRGDEKGVIKIQLDLMVESPISIDIICSKTKEIKLKHNDNEYHHLKIENDVLEFDYKNIKYSVEFENFMTDQSSKSFKYVLKEDNWRIIDIDNFMKGNYIVPYKTIL